MKNNLQSCNKRNLGLHWFLSTSLCVSKNSWLVRKAGKNQTWKNAFAGYVGAPWLSCLLFLCSQIVTEKLDGKFFLLSYFKVVGMLMKVLQGQVQKPNKTLYNKGISCFNRPSTPVISYYMCTLGNSGHPFEIGHFTVVYLVAKPLKVTLLC